VGERRGGGDGVRQVGDWGKKVRCRIRGEGARGEGGGRGEGEGGGGGRVDGLIVVG